MLFNFNHIHTFFGRRKWSENSLFAFIRWLFRLLIWLLWWLLLGRGRRGIRIRIITHHDHVCNFFYWWSVTLLSMDHTDCHHESEQSQMDFKILIGEVLSFYYSLEIKIHTTILCPVRSPRRSWWRNKSNYLQIQVQEITSAGNCDITVLHQIFLYLLMIYEESNAIEVTYIAYLIEYFSTWDWNQIWN